MEFCKGNFRNYDKELRAKSGAEWEVAWSVARSNLQDFEEEYGVEIYFKDGSGTYRDWKQYGGRSWTLQLMAMIAHELVDMEAGQQLYGPLFRSYEYLTIKHAIVTQTPVEGFDGI